MIDSHTSIHFHYGLSTQLHLSYQQPIVAEHFWGTCRSIIVYPNEAFGSLYSIILDFENIFLWEYNVDNIKLNFMHFARTIIFQNFPILEFTEQGWCTMTCHKALGLLGLEEKCWDLGKFTNFTTKLYLSNVECLLQ